jgi:hypothetical protein
VRTFRQLNKKENAIKKSLSEKILNECKKESKLQVKVLKGAVKVK